jgi:hypothetical protein
VNKKILLITPPFTQLNTPYPATMYLKGFLNTIGIQSVQVDLGIEVISEIFSPSGLDEIFDLTDSLGRDRLSDNANRITRLKNDYLRTIGPVINFLQHRNPTLAHSICERKYLPEASRFAQLEDLDWAFGTMGTRDKARHLATLYLEDISDLIVEAIDPHFGFSRYAESLSVSASSFDTLYGALHKKETLVDKLTLKLLSKKINESRPSLAALTVPFPGNLYAALKCGQWIKQNHPKTKVVMGGGFPNTELRSLSDSRVFEFVDFITLDDGEVPIMNLLEHLDGKRELQDLKRTFALKENIVTYYNGSKLKDLPQSQLGTPDYSDLRLDSYLSVIEVANPMHRMWSDGRWNKLTLAHGCYWGKCTFCDISLDYIQRYEPIAVRLLCDRMEAIIDQTGETGFHFVDEAAPPALMKELALEILRRNMTVVWWTNIRFEKSFTYDLCRLLKESGCVAVSGGLEVASDRLLKLIDKGVTIDQVSRVTDNFTRSGIMVHAYLMYGFPTQTAQETIDSLEVVRQMFELGILQSGFWHRFAMTAHSPVGMNPEKFNVKIDFEETGTFANNEIQFTDPVGIDHNVLGDGLRISLFNYMHGIGFDIPLSDWFSIRVPRTKVKAGMIELALQKEDEPTSRPLSKVIWTGATPLMVDASHEASLTTTSLLFSNLNSDLLLDFPCEEGLWLAKMLPRLSFRQNSPLTLKTLEDDYNATVGNDFSSFWNSDSLMELKAFGLLIL